MQLVIERRKTIAGIGVLLALFLLVGFIAPKQAEAASPARAMASLINQARIARGRQPLAFSVGLSNVALRHSRTMAAKDRLYHNPYLADWLRNADWRILGENVGVGGSISSLHDAFMHSPSHRSNILDRRFRKVGVGAVSRNGRVWVTVVFMG